MSVNICRTITRKAERSAIKCNMENKEVIAYLNRLSSLLFVLSRVVMFIFGSIQPAITMKTRAL